MITINYFANKSPLIIIKFYLYLSNKFKFYKGGPIARRNQEHGSCTQFMISRLTFKNTAFLNLDL